jgi:LPXTG-site transpeptidase (sortase) family protein
MKFNMALIYKYKKLIVINVVFLALVALVVWKVNYNERIALTELPVPPNIELRAASATSTPETLIIPSIGVNAHVERAGKTKTGNMSIPRNFEDVAWYELGYTPGTAGNAVIAGHLDNGKGVPAVFNNLSKLKVGDVVYLKNKIDEVLVFKVTSLTLYDYANAPVEKIFGPSDTAHLNLITCDGTWNRELHAYDKRLVVSTDFVGIAQSDDL